MMLRRFLACSAWEAFDGAGWRLADLELMARDSGSSAAILASHVVFQRGVRAPRAGPRPRSVPAATRAHAPTESQSTCSGRSLGRW